MPETLVTRRQLLGAASAAGILSLAASAAPSPPQPSRPVAIATPRPKAPPPPPPPASKPAVHPLAKPVYTLEQFRKAAGGPAFPADAVALTIDDGPHPVWTPKILRLLHKHQVPAMFCMIGNQVQGHESVAKDVVHDGHHVANHTWSHPTHLAKRKSGLVNKELIRAQEKIHDTTGAVPTVFRSPGGDWSPTVLRSAAEHHLIPLDWSDDPRDWSRPGVPHITNRLLAAKPGQILLCHDGGGDRSQTYQALTTVIPALKARGYTFVALNGR
ncbi:polysaccharide deacetylase family protein [Actinoplanes sp. TFC3]|uniref:polysaccharide deacetylase family protein n=1 Tax=Actinoplanes sp. TFC3 TaxID=1710355 RepID=UPI0008318A89|nr:polysaccharide deacetylase family protein [Actinoplanes sp. TFC3]